MKLNEEDGGEMACCGEDKENDSQGCCEDSVEEKSNECGCADKSDEEKSEGCCGGAGHSEDGAGCGCGGHDKELSTEDKLSELFVYKEALEKELVKVNTAIAELSSN